jgi:hypothetical protein
MNTKQVDGILGATIGQSPDQALPASYWDTLSNTTEAVIAAYIDACRGGSRTSQSAFDVAVRVYLARFPETHPNAAARIVADIISHRL